MAEFLINLFLYVFAIYGVMIFIRGVVSLLNGQKSLCKMVIIIEGENVEGVLRDVFWSLQANRIIENIYVINKNDSAESNDIIQRCCADNGFFILTDKQKIMDIISEK